jgi:hypothetical protein
MAMCAMLARRKLAPSPNFSRAAVRTDDGEAITREWLEVCGVEIIDPGTEWIALFRSPHGIEVFLWSDGTVNFGDPDHREPMASRGQFHKLAEALGVPLKEQA